MSLIGNFIALSFYSPFPSGIRGCQEQFLSFRTQFCVMSLLSFDWAIMSAWDSSFCKRRGKQFYFRYFHPVATTLIKQIKGLLNHKSFVRYCLNLDGHESQLVKLYMHWPTHCADTCAVMQSIWSSLVEWALASMCGTVRRVFGAGNHCQWSCDAPLSARL